MAILENKETDMHIFINSSITLLLFSGLYSEFLLSLMVYIFGLTQES